MNNNSILWRLWSTLTHVINDYVTLTNEVNQGNAVNYDFGVVMKSLRYPLECIDLSQLKDAEKNTLMETWSELYETFQRAISLLPGVEENLILRELCKALMEHCVSVITHVFTYFLFPRNVVLIVVHILDVCMFLPADLFKVTVGMGCLLDMRKICMLKIGTFCPPPPPPPSLYVFPIGKMAIFILCTLLVSPKHID